ncbi:MAG: hypothetical protein AAFZ65_15110, partial [Planctomycetota bacterium]
MRSPVMLPSLLLWMAWGPQTRPLEPVPDTDPRVELRLEESPNQAAMGFWTTVLDHAEGVVVCRFKGDPAIERVERCFTLDGDADARETPVHRLEVERVLFGDLALGARLWIEVPTSRRAASAADFNREDSVPLLDPADGDRWLIAIRSSLERVRFDDEREPVRLTRFDPMAMAILGERGSALTRHDLELDLETRRVLPRRLVSGPYRDGALVSAVAELIDETTPSLLLQTVHLVPSSPLWLLPGDAPAGPIGGQGFAPMQILPNANSVEPIALQSEGDGWAP